MFWEAQYYGFFSVDDAAYAQKNPVTQRGLTLDSTIRAFSEFQVGNYHPLTMISLMLDSSLFGADPAAHHRVNVGLHLANTLILFWLLLSITGDKWPSAATALLFAIHPLHVEPVVWISSRKDVLSTLFMLLAIAAYVRFVRKRSWTMYALLCVMFAFALLSKQMAVTLPCVLLLLDYWPLERFKDFRVNPRLAAGLVLEKAPLFAFSVAFSVIIIYAQRSSGALLELESMPLEDRLKNTPLAYVMYIAQTIVPVRMQAIGYRIPHGLPLWQAFGSLAVLVAITVACLRYARRLPYLPIGWFFFLGTLVPVIGLVTLGSTYRADRYTYVPLIGLFIMACWGAADVLRRVQARERRTIALAVVSALLLAYTATAWTQVGRWRDSETMLKHVLRMDPAHYQANLALGDTYLTQGKLLQATEHYIAALKTVPASHFAYVRLGIIQFDLGNYDRAEDLLERGLKLEPSDVAGVIGLVQTKRVLGKPDEAQEVMRRALEAAPDSPALRFEVQRLQQELR